jgi:hypothetical protein
MKKHQMLKTMGMQL